MLKVFLKFELSKINKYFEKRTLPKVITTLLFLLVFFFVSLLIYQFFVSGFRYINGEAVEDIRLALTLFIYESFLLLLACVIIFSQTVSALFSLFKGENNEWVMSTPAYNVLPKIVFVKSFFSSLVPSVIMFLPALIAFNKVNQLNFVSFLFIFVSVFLFLILLNFITLSSLILISFLYYKISKIINYIKFSFKGLVIIMTILVSYVFYKLWSIVSSVDLVRMFRADDVDNILNIDIISSYFAYLPTNNFALEIIYWQNNAYKDAIYNFSLMFTLCLLFGIIFYYISPLFYSVWQRFQEGSVSKEVKSFGLFKNRITYEFTGGIMKALFKKEMLISTRNFKAIMWFLFLFSIWFLQVGTNLLLGKNIRLHQPDISMKMAILQAMQFIIAIYFISAFTLRFVFTTFSAEKKTSWVLLSAPINFRKMFFGKYLFYSVFFVTLGLVMSYINMNALNLGFSNVIYSVTLFIFNVLFIVTLGLSLGAIFPNKETDDPEIISTSMPGLFFTALSLLYGALSSYVLYLSLVQKDYTKVLFLLTVTFFAVILMLFKIPKFIENKKEKYS